MRKACVVLLLLALPRIGYARTSRAAIQVSAYVVNNCSVLAPSVLRLPSYGGAAVRASVIFMLKCTKGAAPLVSVRSGSTEEGGMPALGGAGGALLYYGIFSDAEYSRPWGSISGIPGDGATFKSYSMYLAIPAGQATARGPYSGALDISVDTGNPRTRHFIVPIETSAD
jgi:spore coat protein U-like protein